jgi:hypothetical protein
MGIIFGNIDQFPAKETVALRADFIGVMVPSARSVGE